MLVPVSLIVSGSFSVNGLLAHLVEVIVSLLIWGTRIGIISIIVPHIVVQKTDVLHFTYEKGKFDFGSGVMVHSR